MSVNFKIPLSLQAKAMHKDVVKVEGQTVAEGLEDLIRRYPQLRGEILDVNEKMFIKWMFSINSKIVTGPDDLAQWINAEDIIELLPLISEG